MSVREAQINLQCWQIKLYAALGWCGAGLSCW